MIDGKNPLSILSQSEQMYHNLVENLKTGIYMTDTKGDLFFANQAFVEILGYDRKEEILGRNLARELYVNPPDRDHFLKKMQEKGYVKDYEVKNIRRDGKVVLLSATSNFIKNSKGEVIGVEGIVQDITEKRELEEQIELEKIKLEQILEFDERISLILKLDDLVDFVIEKILEILGARKCSLMLLDPHSKELVVKGAKGLSEEVIEKAKLKYDEPIAGRVAKEGQPLLVFDIETDARVSRKNRSSYTTKSFVSVPIKLGERLIGVVNVADKDASGNTVFNEIDLRILSAIVRQTAVAIENANLYKEVNYLSITDPLTRIFNYRYFVRGLDAEINRVKRYPAPLSLLMADVDDFKLYNEMYGHLEGDSLLIRISQALKENLRSVDIPCRHGGDDFAIILPETEAPHAQEAALKLKNAVEKINFKTTVTFSIGIASFTKHMDRLDLVSRAERALHQAKKEGRNKICSL